MSTRSQRVVATISSRYTSPLVPVSRWAILQASTPSLSSSCALSTAFSPLGPTPKTILHSPRRQASTSSSPLPKNAPKRSSPYPAPSRSSKFSNAAPLSLHSSKADQQLSFYSPDHADAADLYPTWEDVEEFSKVDLPGAEAGAIGFEQEVDWEPFLGESIVSEQDDGYSSPPLPPWLQTEDVKKVVPRIKDVPSTPRQPSTPVLSPLPDLRGPRARPSTETTFNLDSPIQPYRPVLSVYRSPLDPIQPHEKSMLSRLDWRLSAPVPLKRRGSPPSYNRKTDLVKQGLNRLVGVGLDAAREAMRFSGTEDEPWGWKIPVPETQRGSWPSCDAYRIGLDRLINLTREADELAYLVALERSGRPDEREMKGRTVNGAFGAWLGDAASLAAPAEKASGEGRTKLDQRLPSVIASWEKADGFPISPEAGCKFSIGSLLRFTPISPSDNTSAPKPPPTPQSNFKQGTLIQMKDGKLIVSFAAEDHWPIGTDEYRIDVGLDSSSLDLQARAIDNLYFDPVSQQTRNQEHVDAAQRALITGTVSVLREWALQGTAIREILVPDLDTLEAQGRMTESYKVQTAPLDVHDESPRAEISRLARPDIPILDSSQTTDSTVSMHPSALFTDNQLINSWIKRHQRDPPLHMVGDPDLGLNASQTKAVATSLSERLSLIQGPPGTGKSQTIVSIIRLLKYHFRIPQNILLAAPTHVSVDHLLSLLISAGLNPLRSGKADKVRPEFQEWTVEKRQEKHPLWSRCEAAKEQAEKLRDELREWKEKTRSKPQTEDIIDMTQLLQEVYMKAWRKLIYIEHRLYASLLATADVFCSTALGAGSNRVMNLVDFPIVFLDEAAMCTEPVTLLPLMKGSAHVTLIGDHKQLPAVVTSTQARKERLHVSLFERLMHQKSVKSVLLNTQYRMRPCISAFPNLEFYHSALSDSPTVEARPPPPRSRFFNQRIPPTPAPAPSRAPSNRSTKSMSSRSSSSPSLPPPLPLPVVFVTHENPESTDRFSLLNRREVDIILEIVGDLLYQNKTLEASDIGIISPYAAQTRYLSWLFAPQPLYEGDDPSMEFGPSAASQRLTRLLGAHRAADVSRVEVNTVDGFQGREKPVIILSTVRSNRGGYIGFLTDKRRLNVALTRAKDALFVVGSEKTLRMATMSDWREPDLDADGDVWRKYLSWMRENGLVKKWEEMVEEEYY